MVDLNAEEARLPGIRQLQREIDTEKFARIRKTHLESESFYAVFGFAYLEHIVIQHWIGLQHFYNLLENGERAQNKLFVDGKYYPFALKDLNEGELRQVDELKGYLLSLLQLCDSHKMPRAHKYLTRLYAFHRDFREGMTAVVRQFARNIRNLYLNESGEAVYKVQPE